MIIWYNIDTTKGADKPTKPRKGNYIMANLKAIEGHEKIMALADALEDCGIEVTEVDTENDAETMIQFNVFDPEGTEANPERIVTVAAMAVDDYEISSCVEPQ